MTPIFKRPGYVISYISMIYDITKYYMKKQKVNSTIDHVVKKTTIGRGRISTSTMNKHMNKDRLIRMIGNRRPPPNSPCNTRIVWRHASDCMVLMEIHDVCVLVLFFDKK